MNEQQARSTKDQRQAFTESLYSNYAELQRQGEELQERKRKIDVDTYDSNAKEIHGLLFNDDLAAESDLGDWDTYERVQNMIKKVVYGRSTNLYSLEDKDDAMRKQMKVLETNMAAQTASIKKLEEDLRSSQEEVSGLLNLLSLKDSEIRNLIGKANRSLIQMRNKERESDNLRRQLNTVTLQLTETVAAANAAAEKATEQLASRATKKGKKQSSPNEKTLTQSSPSEKNLFSPSKSPKRKQADGGKTTAAAAGNTTTASPSTNSTNTVSRPTADNKSGGKTGQSKHPSGQESGQGGRKTTSKVDATRPTESTEEGRAAPTNPQKVSGASPAGGASSTQAHDTEEPKKEETGIATEEPNSNDATKPNEDNTQPQEEGDERAFAPDPGSPHMPPRQENETVREVRKRFSVRLPQADESDELREIKVDLGLLIEANRQLEKENYLLRGRLQNIILPDDSSSRRESTVQPSGTTTRRQTHAWEKTEVGLFTEEKVEAMKSAPINQDLDNAVSRRELITRELPQTATIVNLVRRADLLRARMEAECRNMMHLLDYDANPKPTTEFEGQFPSQLFLEAEGSVSAADEMPSASASPNKDGVKKGDKGDHVDEEERSHHFTEPLPANISRISMETNKVIRTKEEAKSELHTVEGYLTSSDGGALFEDDGGEVENTEVGYGSNRPPRREEELAGQGGEAPRRDGDAAKWDGVTAQGGSNGGVESKRDGHPVRRNDQEGAPLDGVHGARPESSSYAQKIRESVNSASKHIKRDSVANGEHNRGPSSHRLTAADGEGYQELFLAAVDTEQLYCGELREDLERLKKDFLALRDEVKMFLEIILVAVQSVEQEYQATQEANARHIEQALEKFAEDFISNNTEEKVVGALKEKYGIQANRASLTPEMSDQEWIAQRLTNIALDVAKEKIKEQEEKSSAAAAGRHVPSTSPSRIASAPVGGAGDDPTVLGEVTRLHSAQGVGQSSASPPQHQNQQQQHQPYGRGRNPVHPAGPRVQGYPGYKLDEGRPSVAPSEPYEDEPFDGPEEDVTKIFMEGKKIQPGGARPSMGMQYGWYPQYDDDDLPLMIGNHRGSEIRHRFHNRLDVMQLLKALQPDTNDDPNQIRPTVYRYFVPKTVSRATDRLKNKLHQHNDVINGPHFQHILRDQVAPIATKADDIRKGKGDTHLLTAVRDLRQEDERRRKEHANMLFRQVATNLRTRRLLRVNVYRGNAFSSYVRVLYSQWKKQQNKTKQTKKDEYVQLRDHVLQVCGLKPAVQEVKKTPVAPLPPLRVKAKTSKPNPKYTFGQGKSSTHFSDVQF